jgi:hypothetical protein
VVDIDLLLTDILYRNVPEGTEESHVKHVCVAFVRVEI